MEYVSYQLLTVLSQPYWKPYDSCSACQSLHFFAHMFWNDACFVRNVHKKGKTQTKNYHWVYIIVLCWHKCARSCDMTFHYYCTRSVYVIDVWVLKGHPCSLVLWHTLFFHKNLSFLVTNVNSASQPFLWYLNMSSIVWQFV